jgi:hypothetical protein
MKKLALMITAAVLPAAFAFACGGDKPAESPATTTTSASAPVASTAEATPATSTVASTTPSSTPTSVVAPAASSATPAPVGMMQTVEMRWEIVADPLCKAPEKHVRLRFAAAEGHYTDVCSAKLADELGKKKPKTVRASYLVYRSPDSSSLCEIEGIVKGDKLPKMGCSLPSGWGEVSGGGTSGNNPGPNPLFK